MSETYKDIVITSIDVRRLENGRVEFDTLIKGDKDDTTAVFLENVRDSGRVTTTGPFWNRRKYPIFEGDELSIEQVKGRLPPESVHPLLCIHGASVHPQTHIDNCNKANKKYAKTEGMKLKFIPVLWPSEQNILGYREDRSENSVGGKAFKALTEFAAVFPTKSIVAHSLGSRVVRYFADPEFKFDNIFLVAADVDRRIFNQRYIDKKDDNDDRCKDGLRIKLMLKNNKSKIYVLHNKKDPAFRYLQVTTYFTSPRLGLFGVVEEKLHTTLKNCVENKDFSETPLPNNHSYHFSDEAIDFYGGVIREYIQG